MGCAGGIADPGEFNGVGGLTPGGKVAGLFPPGRNGTMLLDPGRLVGLTGGIVQLGGLMAFAPTGGIGKRAASGNDIRPRS